ncbi:flagellar FLiS export co-chaperone, partial [Helicobacter pylori]|uniref:flagellar FLiS export co-chaperone n=1 Tax=Helicobacter pylori TaxID=210 RepID=UPI001F5BCDCC
MDILKTLQKHLGDVETSDFTTNAIEKSQQIAKFSRDMKNINESVGALQVLQIACKKLFNKSMGLEDKDALQASIIKQELREIVENCQFLASPLFDTLDGAFMLKAYDWAFKTPLRKIYYNISITALSVFIALFIGLIELFQVVSEKLHLKFENRLLSA